MSHNLLSSLLSLVCYSEFLTKMDQLHLLHRTNAATVHMGLVNCLGFVQSIEVKLN